MSRSMVRSRIFSSAWSCRGTAAGSSRRTERHVLRLPTDPSPHVDIAVCRARAVWVDVEADAGLALLAVAATTAGDVERHRADVALLDELDVRPGLDHLAGDLVAEDEPLGGGRAATDHVLVGTADVGRDGLEDHRVRQSAPHVVGVYAGPVLESRARVVDLLITTLPGPAYATALLSVTWFASGAWVSPARHGARPRPGGPARRYAVLGTLCPGRRPHKWTGRG